MMGQILNTNKGIGQQLGIQTLTDSHDFGLVCQGVTMVALHQIGDTYIHI